MPKYRVELIVKTDEVVIPMRISADNEEEALDKAKNIFYGDEDFLIKDKADWYVDDLESFAHEEVATS